MEPSSKRQFARFHSVRLPTPPPDPKESDLLDYLSLTAKSRATSVFAPAIAAEDAFDHLDKLYKLMEQLLNLREQNAKLQRRVRDLEHLRNLHGLQQQVPPDKEIPELDDDAVLAETLLDHMFSKRASKQKPSGHLKLRQSVVRTGSLVDDVPKEPTMTISGKHNPAKVSKWKRVKSAFKWERAASTVTGAKSQDSGIGAEVARYLRVPSTCDTRPEPGASPADSVLSGSWQGGNALSTPATLSPASSTDELTQSEQRSVSRTGSAGNSNASGKRVGISRISDEEDADRRSHSLDDKDELMKLQSSKSHKTPWGKVKDIIQIRKDSLRKKHYRLSSRSDDCRTDWSAGSDQEEVFDSFQELGSPNDTPTVTVTLSDSVGTAKITQTSSTQVVNNDNCHKIPADVLARYQRVAAEEDKCQSKPNTGSPRIQRRISKWIRVKKAFLPSASFNKVEGESISQPVTPVKHFQFFSDTLPNIRDEYPDKVSYYSKLKDDPETRELKEEIYRNYEQLQKKLSQEFQEKLQEWEKVKCTSGNPSSVAYASAQSVVACSGDESRNSEFVRKMEEWEKMKQSNAETNRRRNIQMTSEENLPADFKKKLQEWQKIKKFGGKDEDISASSRKKKTEWQLWRSNSKQENNPSENRHYSEDFLRKLDEWKQIKSSQGVTEDQDAKKVKDNPTSPGLVRKSSTNKLLRQSKKHKMQEWLEKELQKIEREKQRLEREKGKFLEREERLAKLRRSIGTGQHKKDVLVQTSTGFYRFEGISRKFTQKLYEWEKARGIGPEDSTFTLLNSGYKTMVSNPPGTISGSPYRHEKLTSVKLTRSKSMDSVANLTCGEPLITHQPSSLSLNDMEDLEMRCLAESSSDQILNQSEDNLDYPEPEAVIVEVEDFVEETASPLEYMEQNQQTPVYHTEILNLCESEKCEAPKIRRSNSGTTSSNYSLMEESLEILNKILSHEESSRTTESKLSEAINSNREKEKQLDTCRSMGAIPKRKCSLKQNDQQIISLLEDSLNNCYIHQSERSQLLVSKLLLLQEANTNITRNVSYENSAYNLSNSTEAINIIQDISSEVVTIAEKIKQTCKQREEKFQFNKKHLISNENYDQTINDFVTTIILKIKELKRNLTYICAATDVTAPGKRKKGSYKDRKHCFHKRISTEKNPSNSNEKIPENDNTSDEESYSNGKIKSLRKRDRLVKSKSEENHLMSHTAVQKTSTLSLVCNLEDEDFADKNTPRKRLVHKSIHSECATEKFNLETECGQSQRTQKKLIRSRRISETCSESNKEDDHEDPTEKQQVQSSVIIPTNIQYLEVTSDTAYPRNPTSPVSVFVQTNRKIFIPFIADSKQDSFPEKNINSIRDQETLNRNLDVQNCSDGAPENDDKLNNNIKTNKDSVDLVEDDESTVVDNQSNIPITPSHLPPLPNSPVMQRRDRHLVKETSPAIRMMIARYNQKLFEQESSIPKSGGSSESASPVAWRSPVLERRVRAQTEKYEEEMNKSLMNNRYSPLFARKQVQKSASVGVMHPIKRQFTVPQPSEREESSERVQNNSSPKLIRGILKSTSMDCMKSSNQMRNANKVEEESLQKNTLPSSGSKFGNKASQLKLSISTSYEANPVIQERAYKLQKTKEEFLLQSPETPVVSASKTGYSEPTSSPIVPSKSDSDAMSYPNRNRLSQVSMGSESSCDDMKQQSLMLVRSISAGMINVDEVTYQQFRPEMRSQGYVSLPRSTKKKDGKFGISSLASKFRRVKMRHCKEPAEMNTISTLCRQSLIVDITENKEQYTSNEEKSNDQQQSTSKSSWIKNPSRIFKPK